MTKAQRSLIAFALLFAAAAYARNKLQKIETHSGASPGVVTIKGDDFQVATGGSNGDCLVWDTSTDAGVAWDPTCGGGSGLGGSVGVYEVAYGMDGGTLDSEAAFSYNPTTNTLGVDGAATFNDSGADADFRVAAVGEANAFFVQGSDGLVGIGTNAPTHNLHCLRAGNCYITADNSSTSGYASVLSRAGSGVYAQLVAAASAQAGTWFDNDVAPINRAGTVGIRTGGSESLLVFAAQAAVPFHLGQNDTTRILMETGSTTINPNGYDNDTIIKSDNQAACLTVDAATDVIGATCDVQFPAGSIETGEIEDGTLREADLMAVDAAVDEECLTYESTTGDFEWQSCSSGGGDSITVNSSAATDPDFLNGDIDWTLTGGNSITATVACSGCVDATDLAADSVEASEVAASAIGSSELAADSLTPADLNTVSAAGAGQDEYCLTYEHGTTEFEWQVCGSTDADAIHDNVSGEIAAIADKTVVVGGDHFVIEDSAASDAKKDVTLTNLTNSILCQTSGATATYCGLRQYTQNLNATPTFSSATPAVAMTTQTIAGGTYLFRYYIVFASNNTASGIGTSINATGTVTRITWSSHVVTTGGAAATGVTDDTSATNAGQLVEGKSEYRNNTLPSSFAGVAAITNTTLLVVEGLVVTTTSGNLELKIANDAGANTITVYPETTLLLNKVL